MIADILIELAWKSTIVAGAVVALLFVMRSQAPSNRVAVGGLGLALLLVLPAIVAALALLPVPTIEMTAPSASSLGALPMAMSPGPMLTPVSLPPAMDAVPAMPSPEPLVLFLWGAGALVVAARLAAGVAMLWRWTERGGLVSSPRWNAILRRCGVPETTLLLTSDDVSAPLSWGWRMPVILVGRDTLANAAEGEAVIAHEAAHLRRGDWPRLIAARLVVALFWFNPFVWLLERLYLQDIEEAADAEATSHVEPANYAQALLNVARNAAVPAGANSIASGALAKRIKQVLSGRPRSRWERTWRIGALAGVAAVAGPIAVVQFAPAASAAVAASMSAPARFVADIVPVAGPAPVSAPVSAPVATAAPPTPPIAPPTVVAVASAVQAVSAAAPEPTEPAEVNRAEIERIERASEVIRIQSKIIARDSQAIAARAQAEAAAAMVDMRQEMLRGADEMERGAVEMRRGAAEMRNEARKLRDPRYRAEQIAKARARGDRHVPTDQELIDAIPKMEAGADAMEASIPKMREGAAEMRRQAQQR